MVSDSNHERMKIKKITIISLLILFAFGFNFFNAASSKPAIKRFHTTEELKFLNDSMRRAPIAAGDYFLNSTSCRGCHGPDQAHIGSVDESGNDVNLVERWESSMMANAARDPLWRAKVSQEIITDTAHAALLQNKCTSCHAPMGRYNAKFKGFPYYAVSQINGDSLGIDGVACGACHRIGPSVGLTFSGDIPYDTIHYSGYLQEYGPFMNPQYAPMQLYEGITPTYSLHMDKSRVCSSCHTLITQSTDLNGNLTGGEFVEQATYHEYENSNFPANNIRCQTCHMPAIQDAIQIANGFQGLLPRTPFNQHTFAGANIFMLNMLKNNRDTLGIVVASSKFDSTILVTYDLLRNRTIDYHLTLDSVTTDTAFFKVKLQNKAGHKFPSGYPSRRAVVQFVVTDAANDTIFRSGLFDATQRVIGETPSFEPHHDVINQSGVSQIYEMVMGDVNYNYTSILERAANLLKDNRLPPTGFTTSHSVYDTTKISNDALADVDFNKVNTVQGSGADALHFHVSLTGITGAISVRTKVFFQTVPPKFLDEMFTLNSAPINRFRSMYNSADQTPILIASDSLLNVNLNVSTQNQYSSSDMVTVFPTASLDGKVYVTAAFGTLIQSIDVLNANGKFISKTMNTNFQNGLTLNLPFASGVYILRIQTNNKVMYKKVVKV